jgi:hypothetical protein
MSPPNVFPIDAYKESEIAGGDGIVRKRFGSAIQIDIRRPESKEAEECTSSA